MYLPHSREETPDQTGTAEMPRENQLLLAEKLGAWEGGVDKRIPWEGTKKMALEGYGMKSCPWEVTEVLALGPQKKI